MTNPASSTSREMATCRNKFRQFGSKYHHLLGIVTAMLICATAVADIIPPSSVAAPPVSYWSTRSPPSSSVVPPNVTSNSSTSFGKRFGYAAVIDSFDRIFVIGGLNPPNSYMNDVWMLQPGDWENPNGAQWICQTCEADARNQTTRFLPRWSLGAGVTSDIINSTTGMPRLFVFAGYRFIGGAQQQSFYDLWTSDDLGKNWSKQAAIIFDSTPEAQTLYHPRLSELFAFTSTALYSVDTANPNSWFSRGLLPWNVSRVEFGVTQLPGSNGDKWILAGGYSPIKNYPTYNDVYLADLSRLTKNGGGFPVRYTLLTAAAAWSPRSTYLVSAMSPLGTPMVWMYGPLYNNPSNPRDFLYFSSNVSATNASSSVPSLGTNWVRVDNVTVNATTGAPCLGGWPFPVRMDGIVDTFVLLDSRGRLIILTSNNNVLPAQPTGDTRLAVILLNATNTAAAGNLTRWDSCSIDTNTTNISNSSSSSSTGSFSSSAGSTSSSSISSTSSSFSSASVPSTSIPSPSSSSSSTGSPSSSSSIPSSSTSSSAATSLSSSSSSSGSSESGAVIRGNSSSSSSTGPSGSGNDPYVINSSSKSSLGSMAELVITCMAAAALATW